LPSNINEGRRNQQYNESPPQLINAATLPSKMKHSPHSPSRYTTTPKRDKIPHTQKNRSLLVHIVELSTAVVKVDIKVIMLT